MNFTKHLLSLGMGALATALVSCSIPKPECTVGQTSTNGVGLTGLSAFAVRYVVQNGNPNKCPEFKGEVVGFQSYHPASADGKTRDFSKTSIALRTQSLGELTWMTEDLDAAVGTPQPNAVGDFTANAPDDTDFCKVAPVSGAQAISAEVNFKATVFDSDPTLYPFTDDMVPDTCMADKDCNAKVNLVCDPDAGACVIPPCKKDADCNAVAGAVCRVPTGAMDGACAVPVDLPATDLKYEWTNMSFYVTAGATGTQMSADVKITINGCAADYKAIGLWPAVDCTDFLSPDAAEATTTACKADADCAGDSAHPTCSPDAGVCVHQCKADADCTKADFNVCDKGSKTCSHHVTGDELCDPAPDSLHGRPVGSGVNPDFGPVTCQADVAVVPIVDSWYSIPDISGAPISVPRCTISQDTVPAIDATKNPPSTAPKQ